MSTSLLSTACLLSLLVDAGANIRADLGEDYQSVIRARGKPTYERIGPNEPRFVCGTWTQPGRWTFVEAWDGRVSQVNYFHVSSAEAEEIMREEKVRLPNGEILEFVIENRTERMTTWSAGRSGGSEYRAVYGMEEIRDSSEPPAIPELMIYWQRDW
jgi:hypothetical protein